MAFLRLSALLYGVHILAALALPALAQPYSGPPDPWTGYWAVPAFSDIPYRGPEKAKGALFWSHGRANDQVQYDSPPPEIIRRFARDGWDVIKVQRNPLFERDWSATGPKHVADVQQRARKALAEGYKRILLAGQSYGGAISVEAANGDVEIFGVMSFVGGHGSDATDGYARKYDNLTGYMLRAMVRIKAERALIMQADRDIYRPREAHGPRYRQTLAALNIPFILLDETMPITSHSAAYLRQFDLWYGRCLTDFFNPAKPYAPGEISCKLPDPLPKFIYPPNLVVRVLPPDVATATRSILGPWEGVLAGEDRDVGIVVEKEENGHATFAYVLGSGPNKDKNMSGSRRQAVREDGKYVSRREGATIITMSLDENGETLHLHVVSRDGTKPFTAALKRTSSP